MVENEKIKKEVNCLKEIVCKKVEWLMNCEGDKYGNVKEKGSGVIFDIGVIGVWVVCVMKCLKYI